MSSSATARTGVGSEILLLREGTSIDILLEESVQREVKNVPNLLTCIQENALYVRRTNVFGSEIFVLCLYRILTEYSLHLYYIAMMDCNRNSHMKPTISLADCTQLMIEH